MNNTERNANTGYGLIASGMTKAGASGAPTLMPAGTLAITGSYQLNNPTNGTGDTLGATEIGRLATLKVGGNFIVENMQNKVNNKRN